VPGCEVTISAVAQTAMGKTRRSFIAVYLPK